jgi:hypothetical protein
LSLLFFLSSFYLFYEENTSTHKWINCIIGA